MDVKITDVLSEITFLDQISIVTAVPKIKIRNVYIKTKINDVICSYSYIEQSKLDNEYNKKCLAVKLRRSLDRRSKIIMNTWSQQTSQ